MTRFKLGDPVKFITNDQFYYGTIGVVDPYGTFEQHDEPSYDIFVSLNGELTLWKHIRQSNVFDVSLDFKVIDFELKGNVVRLYLGKDGVKEYWGDDWNDRPYEHNAGRVYDEYIYGHIDLAFAFDMIVREPAKDWGNSSWSKLDMKNCAIPCIAVLPSEKVDWNYEFEDIALNKDAFKIYFNDRLSRFDGGPWVWKEIVLDNVTKSQE